MEMKLSLFIQKQFGKSIFLFLSFILLTTAGLFAQEALAVENQIARSITYCPTDPCPCDGNYSEIQVYYFGEDNVTIEAYSDVNANILITTYVGVNSGDLLTINGAALVYGTLGYKTYLHTIDALGESCVTKIHTSCPSLGWPGSRDDLKILGEKFGDFTVYSRTDSESHFECDISNVAQDWHVGGNVIGPANNTLGTRNNENLVFITHDDARGTITNTGDFGINTLSPAAQLDVQGDAIVNETLDVNGVTRVNDVSPSATAADGALIVAGGAGIAQNLNVGNNARISNDLAVGNDAEIGRDAMVGRNLNVSVDATIINDLDVGNDGAIGNDLAVAHNAAIANDMSVGRNADVGQNLSVTDNASVGDDLTVGQNADITNNMTVGQNASVGQTLSVGNDANVGDDLDVNGNAHVNGIVTIGTNNTPNSLGTVNTAQYQLYVDGGILTEEVLVRTGWADYVFNTDYKRPSLEEVEDHITEHGHLPNTPSAQEVENNGLSLGNATVNQQEKIEELFLHLIEMNKSIKVLQLENQALKTELQSLNK